MSYIITASKLRDWAEDKGTPEAQDLRRESHRRHGHLSRASNPIHRAGVH